MHQRTIVGLITCQEMADVVVKIAYDYRWVLLLLIALVVSSRTWRYDLGKLSVKNSVIANSPLCWSELGLTWDSCGLHGAGVYRSALVAKQKSGVQLERVSDNRFLVAPRLAVFTFQPFDLNQVDADTLQIAKGFGPKLAVAIIEYRQMHGPFRTIDDLLDVKGIGPAKLKSLRPYLALSRVNHQ